MLRAIFWIISVVKFAITAKSFLARMESRLYGWIVWQITGNDPTTKTNNDPTTKTNHYSFKPAPSRDELGNSMFNVLGKYNEPGKVYVMKLLPFRNERAKGEKVEHFVQINQHYVKSENWSVTKIMCSKSNSNNSIRQEGTCHICDCHKVLSLIPSTHNMGILKTLAKVIAPLECFYRKLFESKGTLQKQPDWRLRLYERFYYNFFDPNDGKVKVLECSKLLHEKIEILYDALWERGVDLFSLTHGPYINVTVRREHPLTSSMVPVVEYKVTRSNTIGPFENRQMIERVLAERFDLGQLQEIMSDTLDHQIDVLSKWLRETTG